VGLLQRRIFGQELRHGELIDAFDQRALVLSVAGMIGGDCSLELLPEHVSARHTAARCDQQVVVFSRDLRDEGFKLAGRIHHTNEVMDLGDHAADGRRVRQIDHAADAVEAESFKRLALNAGTPDRAFDLFNRNRRLWHRRLPACLRLRSNRSQLFKTEIGKTRAETPPHR